MSSVNSAGMTNPTGGLIYFFIITAIYTVFNYNSIKKPDKPGSSIYFSIYMMMVIIGELFINISLTAGTCGSPQYSTAIISTILPWGFMFGILTLLLSIFPGWLAPFSNTFGYGITLLAGLTNTINDILEPNPDGAKASPDNEFMQQALAHIYSDKSMLINEITPSNFDYFWTHMKGIFQKGVFENKELKDKLYSLVQLKYSVATFVWYMLAGLLVTSVSFNYIVNSACGISASEMKKRHKQYEEEMDADHQKNLDSKPRIYSSTE